MISVRSCRDVGLDVQLDGASGRRPSRRHPAPRARAVRSRSTVRQSRRPSPVRRRAWPSDIDPLRSARPDRNAPVPHRRLSAAVDHLLGRRDRAMITVGAPEPPGKCRGEDLLPALRSRPRSGTRRSAPCRSALSCGTNATPTSSTTRGDDPDQPRPRADQRALPGPTARCARLARSRACGRTARTRPGRTSASIAGRNVSAANSAEAMPMAATGPSPWFELRSLNSRHSSAEDHRARGRGDRLDRRAPRPADRDEPVVGLAAAPPGTGTRAAARSPSPRRTPGWTGCPGSAR